ncbi:MAG TPA: YibE/F family protein [Tissierellales bacterium]|nr:YibE/F family protein [Tissierellales bacterium]
MKKNFQKVLIVIVIIFSIIVISKSNMLNQEKSHYKFEKAIVKNINEEKMEEDNIIEDLYLGYQQIEIEIVTGKYTGETFNIKNPINRLYNIHTEIDDKIIVNIEEENNDIKSISVYNHQKEQVVYILIGGFFILLILLSGWKGVKAVLSLIFTGIMIIFFMIPMLFKGHQPIPLTIITVAITTIVTLLLIDKPSKKTLSAILGTIIGVIIAGIISYVSSNIANISGLTSNEAEGLIYIAEHRNVQISGLTFSAILIASLGAIMDVAMSIASSVFEIDKNNPKIISKELFKSGMNIGKDIMGTMSNTLILAFAGSSLNIILFMAAYEMPYRQVVNLDFLVSEVIQGISGSIGIILTVPITAFISSYLAKK